MMGKYFFYVKKILRHSDVILPMAISYFRLVKRLLLLRPVNPSLPSVLVVIHESSRTGAPILGLNIARTLSGKYNVVALVLDEPSDLDSETDLYHEFKNSTFATISARYLRHDPRMLGLVMTFLNKKYDFKFCIVNSIECRSALHSLVRDSIPIVCLVHEFSSCYPEPDLVFGDAFYYADELIFSSSLVVADSLNIASHYRDRRDIHILPQGKSSSSPGNVESAEYRAEYERVKELVRPANLPKESIVVLGAGTIQFRKGVDLFIEVAARIVRNDPFGAKYRFVWFGKGYDPEADPLYSVYLKDQILRSNLQGRLFIEPETIAIDAAYEQMDVFMLSSRLDPLPNVAIDSLVHGVPVFCFDQATGMVDVINNAGLGEVCISGYLDTAEMAHKIESLMNAGQQVYLEVSEKCRKTGIEIFSMDTYVKKVEEFGLHAAKKIEQQKLDVQTILDSGLYDKDFSAPADWYNFSLEKCVKNYVRAWSTGFGKRKPFAGFHPGIYAEKQGLILGQVDPLAHYIRAGKPIGPWCYEVIGGG